jgi:membrane glycosyltransferase
MDPTFSINQIPAQAIRRRRLTFAGVMFLVFVPGFVLMFDIISNNGFTVLELISFAIFVLLFAQVTFGLALSATGYWLLRKGGDPYRISNTLPLHASPESLPSTAILVPIFNEEVDRVFRGIKVMYESLQRTGRGGSFDFFVLSDSNDPNHWIEEEKSWLDLCKEVNGFGRIFYRKRRVTLNHKSGNIADFCRRWGANYRYMIVADADSIMSGELFVRLVGLMEQNRSAGIIQTAPQLVLGKSLFRRIQQFSTRIYGPLFLAGAYYWHLRDGNYWGHNAIIRIKAFVDYCALPELPKFGPIGGRILSHDTVEAALMRKAGYSVCLCYDLDGSYEEGPPHLPASVQRDRRWCQGNLQHLLVLFGRGLKSLSRIHILVGIMAYVSAPLWLVFMILTMVQGFLESSSAVNSARFSEPDTQFKAGLLFGYVMVLLCLPKFFGFLTAMQGSNPLKRSASGFKILVSVLGETLFSILLAPILMLFYTKFVFSTLTGLKVRWNQQERGEQQLTWREAFSMHAGQTIFALVWFVGTAWLWPSSLPWLAPVLLGLLCSVPFTRITSSVNLGEAAKAKGLFLIPEEVNPPEELRALEVGVPAAASPFFQQQNYAAHYGLLQSILDPYIHSVHVSLLRSREQVSEKKQEYVDGLSERLLLRGPCSLTNEERNALLWDPDSLIELHKKLWLCPGGTLHQWWQNALRHYNESIAITVRRSVN